LCHGSQVHASLRSFLYTAANPRCRGGFSFADAAFALQNRLRAAGDGDRDGRCSRGHLFSSHAALSANVSNRNQRHSCKLSARTPSPEKPAFAIANTTLNHLSYVRKAELR